MYEIDKKKFGAFVARLRKEKGYTQKELAEKLYLSDKAVSKWETGVSLPDTAMFLPLAEILGVTVTELLLCERGENPMEASQVEELVQTVIRSSEDRPACMKKSFWKPIYFCSLLMGAMLLWVQYRSGRPSSCVVTGFLLGAVFGGYYCFGAKEKLPAYYDQNQISGVADGVFRMNVPGLYFNNSNWPHILLIIRIWACCAMTVYPVLAVILSRFAWWSVAELYVFLTLLLGGLFVPVYVVGKKFA